MIYLLNNSIGHIRVKELHGIDALNSVSWKGFSKKEFTNLLSLFVYLDKLSLFSRLPDDHVFVFNFSTDVTEMDITTVVEKDEQPVFVDIESKNGTNIDLKGKMLAQLEKRKETLLPQLLKGKPYLTIGLVNNEWCRGYYFDGQKLLNITDLRNACNIMNLCSTYDAVEGYLRQVSNVAAINKIWEDIEAGRYTFYEDTKKHASSLISEIGKSRAAIVYGDAGTGKTILTLDLFHQLSNAKLLELNSKFYYALQFDKKYYFEGKATFSTKTFLRTIGNDSISIVDECQRLSVDQMEKIIRKSKMTFLFGDSRQACFEDGTLLPAKELAEELKQRTGFDILVRQISKARRYSDEVDKALSFLTGKGKYLRGARIPKDYQIRLFYDEAEFLKRYNSLSGIKKIYVPFNQGNETDMEIAGETFYLAERNFDDFSLCSDHSNYYGLTYHALSFDVDHCFVFLKNIHLVRKGKNRTMFYKSEYPDDPDKIDLFLNELNVLFTRGRKSLNIYVNDIETYLHLKVKISKM